MVDTVDNDVIAQETQVQPEAKAKEPRIEDVLGNPSVRISNRPLAPLNSDDENEKKKKDYFGLDGDENQKSKGRAADDNDPDHKKNETMRELLHRMWGVDIDGIEGVTRVKTFDQKAYKDFWFYKNSIAFESEDGQAFLWQKNQDGSETIARYMNTGKKLFKDYTSEKTAAAMINVAYQRNIYDLYLGPESPVRERDVMWFAAQMKTLKLIQNLKMNSLDPETGADALTGVEKFREMTTLSDTEKKALTGQDKEILKNAQNLEALKTVKIVGYVPLREAKLMQKFMNELSQQPPDVQEAFYLKTGMRAPGQPGMEQAADKNTDASAKTPDSSSTAKEQLALPPSPERKLLGMGSPLPEAGGGPSSKYIALPPGPETKALPAGETSNAKALNSGYEGLDPMDAAWLKTMRDNLDKVRSGSSEPLTKPGAFNADSPAFKSFLQELGSQDKGVQEKFISEMKKVSGQPIGQIGNGQKALPEGTKPKRLGM